MFSFSVSFHSVSVLISVRFHWFIAFSITLYCYFPFITKVSMGLCVCVSAALQCINAMALYTNCYCLNNYFTTGVDHGYFGVKFLILSHIRTLCMSVFALLYSICLYIDCKTWSIHINDDAIHYERLRRSGDRGGGGASAAPQNNKLFVISRFRIIGFCFDFCVLSRMNFEMKTKTRPWRKQ